jgi:micrococcal nuclease
VRDRHLSALLLVLLAAAAIGCADGPVRAPSPGAGIALPAGLDTTVERVVDGDTLVVSGGHHVRLIGVDTPETKDPRRPVQCFGREAAGFLTSLLPRGTGVRLVGDVEQQDQYDRTLAYVYRLPDGLFVNAELVRNGYAQVLTVSPNVAHADEFVALAAEASAAGRGLWSACEP